MQSRSGNPLATLMLSLPLMAIPLMAVFGVPQFAPVVASSTSNAERVRLTRVRTERVGESAAPQFRLLNDADDRQFATAHEMFDDPFHASEQNRERSGSPRNRSRLAETSNNIRLATPNSKNAPQDADAEARLAELFGIAKGDVTEARPLNNLASTGDLTPESLPRDHVSQIAGKRPVSRSQNSAEGLTWRQAVRQLNQLGIQDFRLEAGRDPGEFYFACEFSPNGNPQVVRRFEAEASEPLQAVEQVLQQINDWSARR